MTEKLYYLDAYVSEFEATVLGCAEENGRFSIRLDRTAFFPNEGGQDVDTGTLDDIPVTNVIERDGEIFHIAEAPLSVGAAVREVSHSGAYTLRNYAQALGCGKRRISPYR